MSARPDNPAGKIWTVRATPSSTGFEIVWVEGLPGIDFFYDPEIHFSSKRFMAIEAIALLFDIDLEDVRVTMPIDEEG